jgi:hypothetical protein
MSKYWFGAAGALVAALALGACGTGGSASGPSSTAAPPKTTPTTAPPTTTAPSAPAPPATAPPTSAPAAPAAAGDAVPVFQPSTVVSQASGHTQLTSPQGVGTVTAFYENALHQNGWSITSNAKTATSANFVAHKSGQGATVSISTMGPSGTSVSISTYPG